MPNRCSPNIPRIGTPIGRSARKLVLQSFPLLLIYREQSDRLLVLAVAHQGQHPRTWLGRL